MNVSNAHDYACDTHLMLAVAVFQALDACLDIISANLLLMPKKKLGGGGLNSKAWALSLPHQTQVYTVEYSTLLKEDMSRRLAGMMSKQVSTVCCIG
jgi:hypothetical protein